MSGVAGRTDYGDWQKKTSDLLSEIDQEEASEKEQAQRALGLDGKYARSEAEANERRKAKEVENARKVLDGYREREGQIMATFSELLGGVTENNDDNEEETKAQEATTVRLSRERMDEGKRVITICDTKGSSSNHDKIILTQDLSHLESKMNAPSSLPTKEYPEDSDNGVKPSVQQRSIYGIIKLFISNVHNCTIVVNCKVITGTIEVSHCSGIVIQIEKGATIATIQADLCQDVSIEFHDAPSGKHSALGSKVLYWGDDADDRIFHAGVNQMRVAVYREGSISTECTSDYVKDGAVAVGNAAAEEYQFITSIVDGKLLTEKVIRHGSTTGKNARAMTQRELDQENAKREQAASMAIKMAEGMIKILDKDGNELAKKESVAADTKSGGVEIKTEIDDIVAECEQNKSRANEAFTAGEYGQAILLYTIALDKAAELPDKKTTGSDQLFPRHVVLSNRSACFLKLGDHEKALADATKATTLDSQYVKSFFRKGLAFHALGNYSAAIESLAAALKLEPKNKQIKQALQFAEVRMTQEMRQRMS